jgi:hypothetical protein
MYIGKRESISTAIDAVAATADEDDDAETDRSNEVGHKEGAGDSHALGVISDFEVGVAVGAGVTGTDCAVGRSAGETAAGGHEEPRGADGAGRAVTTGVAGGGAVGAMTCGRVVVLGTGAVVAGEGGVAEEDGC